ncbi:MAG: outer membrane lipoprotein-sorting protein, partial [Gammaproteobacteria bacterium]
MIGGRLRRLAAPWLLVLAGAALACPAPSPAASPPASSAPAEGAALPDPAELVRRAMEHYRGRTAWLRLSMRIHRPRWERRLELELWSRGLHHSLVRVLAPARDRGNATLLVRGAMWVYNPRIRRVLRVPASLMQRAWMGSDFSNDDVARSARLVDQYRHRLLGVEERDGHRVYRIRSVPLEEAPVVWGFEDSLIRDDLLFLEHAYFDQEGRAVKRLRALRLGTLDGRPYVLAERMERLDRPGRWTEVAVRAGRFGLPLPPGLFTLEAL